MGAKGQDGIDSGLGRISSGMAEGLKTWIRCEDRFRVRGEKGFWGFGDYKDFPDALFELSASFVFGFQFFFCSFL